MDGEKLAELHNRTREAADALQACAEEVYDLAGPFEKLTREAAASYAGTRAGELRRALEVERATR